MSTILLKDMSSKCYFKLLKETFQYHIYGAMMINTGIHYASMKIFSAQYSCIIHVVISKTFGDKILNWQIYRVTQKRKKELSV
jgi:hypothetical protein